MPKTINRLTAFRVGSLKKPGLHADGAGLYLRVDKGGSKSWVFRYMFDRRPRYLGLGSAASVSLAVARLLATEARQKLELGQDPIEAKREVAKAAAADKAKSLTFKQCAEAYMAAHEPSWKNVRHRQQWRTTMKEFVYPRLGDKITDDIETEHILNVLEPVWMKTPETASRVRGRIEVVLDWAKARGLRDGDNPARWRGHLANLLPKVSKVAPVKHLPAMAFDEVPAFVAELRSVGSHTALALELLVLTATRANETLGATWSEFDLEKKVWCIPAARMKAGREHRVPLSDRAIEILKEVESVRQTVFVFPGLATGRPLRSMALLRVLKRMQRDGITVHGFRSSFRDWAAETTHFPNFVVEMALAHSVADKVEAAYRRGDLFLKRRALMDAWAAFCQRQAATVIRIAERIS